MTTRTSIDYVAEAENAIANLAKIKMGLKCKILGIWGWSGSGCHSYEWSIYDGRILCSLIANDDRPVWFSARTRDFRDDLCPKAASRRNGRIAAGPIMYDKLEMLERLLKRTVTRYETKIQGTGYTQPKYKPSGFGDNADVHIYCEESGWLGPRSPSRQL